MLRTFWTDTPFLLERSLRAVSSISFFNLLAVHNILFNEFLFQGLYHFVRGGHDTAHTAVVGYRCPSVCGQQDVFHHLPALISKLSIPLTCRLKRAISTDGKGHKVIGRNRPTLIPSARHISMTFCPIRAAEPNATIRYSASSHRMDSKRTSFSLISLYLACKCRFFCSMLALSRSSDVSTLGRLPWLRPMAAQGHSRRISSSVRRGLNGGSTSFSIICPMTPSLNIMAGLRYLKESSKARSTKSAISCTEAGASTITL